MTRRFFPARVKSTRLCLLSGVVFVCFMASIAWLKMRIWQHYWKTPCFISGDVTTVWPATAEWSRFQLQAAVGAYQSHLDDAVVEQMEDKLTPMDIFGLLPITLHCDPQRLLRIGGQDDGGKVVCGEYFSYKGDQCAIFSIGSHGNFKFELDMQRLTQGRCQIHTFDCTGHWTAPPGITFHPWCLSGSDYEDDHGRQFKSYGSLIQELGLTKIDYLKMDIEGYEWAVLPSLLLHNQTSQLPRQISMELHLFPPDMSQYVDEQQPDGVLEPFRFLGTRKFLRPTLRLFKLLGQRGFHIASWEYNWNSIEECCSEYVFIRSEEDEKE